MTTRFRVSRWIQGARGRGGGRTATKAIIRRRKKVPTPGSTGNKNVTDQLVGHSLHEVVEYCDHVIEDVKAGTHEQTNDDKRHTRRRR